MLYHHFLDNFLNWKGSFVEWFLAAPVHWIGKWKLIFQVQIDILIFSTEHDILLDDYDQLIKPKKLVQNLMIPVDSEIRRKGISLKWVNEGNEFIIKTVD